jgi:DTW domain-containing protein
MKPANHSTRQYCYNCFKPEVVCICHSIIPVHNQTRIQILQHPLERHHPIGTARFAVLGLTNATLKTVYADLKGSLATDLTINGKTGLLFPSAEATALDAITSDDRPETLIVLDGTWYNAAKLYRENPWLGDLPHYKLSPRSPSRYRIRMEPSRDSISTLEAIVEALHILEPQTDCQPLITAFDRMIDRQIAFMDSGMGHPRKKRPRKRRAHTIPRALIDHFSNTVVVYTENIRLSDGSRTTASVCAQRLGDGRTFEAFIHLPREHAHRIEELRPSGILELHAGRARSADAVVAEWNRFIRPEDILCSWNKGALQSLFQIPGMSRQSYLFLKAAYGNMVKEKFGPLEEVIQTLKIQPEAGHFQGRASERMANAVAIATWLHEAGTVADSRI